MKNQANVLLAKKLAVLEKKTKTLVPEIYSAFCSVLFNKYGWNAEQIAELISYTQEEWDEMVKNDSVSGMIEWCEKITGICLKEGE